MQQERRGSSEREAGVNVAANTNNKKASPRKNEKRWTCKKDSFACESLDKIAQAEPIA